MFTNIFISLSLYIISVVLSTCNGRLFHPSVPSSIRPLIRGEDRKCFGFGHGHSAVGTGAPAATTGGGYGAGGAPGARGYGAGEGPGAGGYGAGRGPGAGGYGTGTGGMTRTGTTSDFILG